MKIYCIERRADRPTAPLVVDKPTVPWVDKPTVQCCRNGEEDEKKKRREEEKEK